MQEKGVGNCHLTACPYKENMLRGQKSVFNKTTEMYNDL